MSNKGKLNIDITDGIDKMDTIIFIDLINKIHELSYESYNVTVDLKITGIIPIETEEMK